MSLDAFGLDVAAGMVVWALGLVVAYLTGRRNEKNRYLARQNSAVMKFANELSEAINRISDDVVRAKTIIRLRNNARLPLNNLVELLNSDIDRLERLIAEIDKRSVDFLPIPQVMRDQVGQHLEVIRGTWHGKKAHVDTSIKQLLVALGVSELA